MRSGVLSWGAATIALVASGAVNSADLKPAVKVPPVLWSWTGGYFGAHVGGGYGRTSFSDPYGPSIYGDVVDTPVFLQGGQIGYNWQKANWVIGVEVDASGAASDGTNTCFAVSGSVVSATCNASPNVFVTGTGRLGYAFGSQGHTLAYLKGGVAWQHNQGDVVNNDEFRSEDHPDGLASQNATHFEYGRFGGTIGAGVEQALTPAWSVGLEYDYLWFGGPGVATPPTVQLPLATVPANITHLSSSYHIGKIALNYHFGADPRTPGWFDTPLQAATPPVSALPTAFTQGWSLESGTRFWLSRGRFQWNHGGEVTGSDLESRITYHNLDGISGELFERVDSPWGIFLKGNIGMGRFNNGNTNDEDWGADTFAYSNTTSGQTNGRFTYYTADAGYDFLRGTAFKVGGFMGWTYYGQKSDTTGCAQIASSPPCHQAVGGKVVVGSQDTDWNALRIGLSAETVLLDRWRVSADVAYLPWTDFQGRDNHLRRPLTTFENQRGGGGGGVQVEGVLSYFLTNNFSVGVGARYWAMWTSRHSKELDTRSETEDSSPVTAAPNPANYRMERWGTFLQASYKFD
ncbi:outer membrane beta-barrel protein [Bradyrhizobium xenonodulans]|uniref:Outer membrane beta-barrel protein n=1 Tax=Bradyrhizobium xenonodulans TaxID=2736875 RepID=A0ABY7MK52_9BRAD|nr:outer membrane beta-barrel protein [Bradyrhizobium xenonodulans]WBL77742.1 outer membrane beta-barrel protein [Bradyrhizobium xenonodulans]